MGILPARPEARRFFIPSGYPVSSAAIFLYLVPFPSLFYGQPVLAFFGPALLFALVALETIWRRGIENIRAGAVETLLLLILAGYTAPLLLNDEPVVLFDAFERLFMLMQVFLFFLFLRCALSDEIHSAGGPRGRALRKNIFTIILVSVILHAGIGAGQVLFQDVYRIHGRLGNPNFFAGMLAAAFCLLLPWTLRRYFPRSRGVCGKALTALLIVLILLLLATRSRGGAGALLIVTGVFLWMTRGMVKALIFSAAAVALIAVIPNPLSDRMVRLNPSLEQFHRSFIWRVDLSLIRDHPMGLGPNMGKYHFSARAVTLAPLAESAFKKRRDPAHNLFIEAGLEGGVPAAAALLLLVLWIAHLAWKRRRAGADLSALGGGLGALVIFLHAQVECLDRSHVVLVLAALLFAFFLMGIPHRTFRPLLFLRICGPVPARLAASLVVVAMAGFSLTGPVSEWMRFTAAGATEDSPPGPEAQRWLYHAQKICPWNYHVSMDRFQIAWNQLKGNGRMGSYEVAYNNVLRAMRLNPVDADLYRKFGRFLKGLPPDIASTVPRLTALMRAVYRFADELDPLDVVARLDGLVNAYLPEEPAIFLNKSGALLGLPEGFALLEYHRAACFEQINNGPRALASYQNAWRAYYRSRAISAGLPEGTRIRSFHEHNVRRFLPGFVQERIRVLGGE